MATQEIVDFCAGHPDLAPAQRSEDVVGKRIT
jgi:hypothetical protein